MISYLAITNKQLVRYNDEMPRGCITDKLKLKRTITGENVHHHHQFVLFAIELSL